MPSKTTLITGSTGFLGSHIAKNLVKNNYKIIALKRRESNLDRVKNICNKINFYNIENNNIDSIFEKHSPDIVIHCATNYGHQLQQAQAMIDTNIYLPLTLLHACIQHKKALFINTDTVLNKQINAYSLSKKQFYEWLKHFSPMLTCVNIALENFYGPDENPSTFCTKIIRDLLDNKPIIKLTPGKQKRGFIYIKDVVDAFMRIIKHSLTLPKGLHNFEVGAKTNIEIKEFVLLIKKLIGNKKSKLNFGALDYRPHECMEHKLDLAPIINLGWEPKFDLKQGLVKTIASARNKYKCE